MTRLSKFLKVASILWVVPLASQTAAAAETSCDIITGASCFIEEGCDCDHDGYVRKQGKSAQYCHYDRCPIDGDDDNPNILGVPSENNLDGDGWTSNFDCDDENPCVGNSCEARPNCSPDLDGDGFAQGDDCDDSNENVFPEASIACCSCEVLSSTESRAENQCEENPCPSSQLDENDADSQPQGQMGTPYADATASPPLWAATTGDEGTTGGGVTAHEHNSGWLCSASQTTSNQTLLTLWLSLLILMALRAWKKEQH